MLKLLRKIKARYDQRQRELDEAWELLARARRGEGVVLTWRL